MARPKAELTRKVRKERFDELLDHFLTEAVHLGFRADEVMALVSAAKQFQWQMRANRQKAPRPDGSREGCKVRLKQNNRQRMCPPCPT